MSQEFDVVVLGAGPVGENVADYAHRGGLSVAIIEADRVGGECSYWACMPSKALLRPVHAVDAARRVGGAQQAVRGRPDASATLDRRDAFVSHYDDAAQVSWLEDAGITLVRGHGRLTGPRQVAVRSPGADRELTARLAVVVCTGSIPRIPPIPGLADAWPWTSRDATGMTSVPKRLAIVGGGVVACEMATAVAGLGADEVTMLVRDDRLLRRMEPFAADQLAAALTARGVDVRLSTTAERVTRPDGQGTPVRLDLSDGGRVEADEVLVATGRRPRSDDIGMESVGLTAGDPLRTEPDLTVAGVSDGWLFAAGDITGTTLLTHQGKYQARLLGDRLAAVHRGHEPDSTPWGAHVPTADTWAVPQVVFSDPEVASVGLTAAQADERGIDTRLLTYDLGQIAGAAVHADGYSGQAAMLIDTAREVVLGVTFVGQDVAELLHAATIAIVGEVPLHRLWHAVPAFPTMSEVWLRLLEEWRGR